MSAFCSALMVFAAPANVLADEWFITPTEGDFATAFESANLTAFVQHDWPRVLFYHTEDIFSPTFDIGMPVIYLFNDSDGDGMFARSEIRYLAYLDAHHNVSWNISSVVLDTDSSQGQYAVLSRWADVALYDDREAIEPVVKKWARVYFSFRITENPVTYENTLGTYLVRGKVDMRVNFTVSVLSPVNASGMVIEQSMKGGMNTNTFLITEDLGLGYLVQTQALSRVDETENGEDFAHRLDMTSLPTQRIEFAKEDGTVQAYYKFSSVPLFSQGENVVTPNMNCSYYTTGTGLVVHTAYLIANETGNITQDMSLGIDESGFYTGVRDWFTENMSAILIVSGSIVAVTCLGLFVLIRRRSKRAASQTPAPTQDSPPEGPLGG